MKSYSNNILGLIFVWFGIVSSAYGQSSQPNFLILLGDDISASNIGCYNSKNPGTTPHIDKLAEEGIRFTNMFVAEAMCAPTRAELYTGMSPYKNGCTVNHAATKTGTLSIVQHLEKLGYRVGLTGKRHFRPKSVYPFEFIDGFTPNCTLHGNAPENWEGVEEFVSRNPEQPFCLIICSVHAHSPWDAGDASLWDLDELKLPKNLVDTKETRHYYREYLAEIRLFDEQVGKARETLKKHKLDESTALIVLDENGVGMPGGKWTTYDLGVRSACIMKWPKPYAAHFETDAIGKYCDILPTLIDAAGGVVSESMDGESLLPLIAGKKKEHREKAFFIYNSGPEGPAFSSRAVTDGRYKLIWTLTPENLYAVRTINGFDYFHVDKFEDRDVRKMYLSWLTKAGYDKNARDLVQRFRQRPEFQLFDLNSDPEEMNNLAEDRVYADKLQELKIAIHQWMEEQGDLMIK
ncbi:MULTISPECIES: sulfatase family protein [unclassified Saccharicrinis]|uniref:sulfatase family protein n=1 Tax=unclassified Saccharicrinis TaxID=2646859 RepID=UPI003D33729D